jgi:hypothetical protein
MPPRTRLSMSLFAVALLDPRATLAAASERGCAGPQVEANAEFRSRFPELLVQLSSSLPGGKQVDPCAVVELRASEAGIVVTVALPDGRVAAREVAGDEDVLPALQGLLLVPEPRPTPARSAPARSVAQRGEAPRGATQDAPPAVTTTRAREYGFELSVLSGARAGDGQYGYGGGVLSFVEIKRWLLGFQGRADGYRSLQGSDPETALALGLLLGRRFELGDCALDFTAGPAVAMRGMTFGETRAVSVQAGGSAPSPAAAPLGPEREVGPVPRLQLGARLGFSPRSIFRTFVGIDGELGPRGPRDARAIDVPGAMPAYTVGLSLGATVGTR